MDKEIVIIEGPAGSGKSRLTDELVRFGYYLPKRVKLTRGLRNFGKTADKLSMLKDQAALTEAVISDYEKIVIDRCFFSQLVYESIRQGHSAELYAQEYAVELINKVRQLNSEISLRNFSDPNILRLKIVWVIPEPQHLELFRAMGEKEYPFPLQKEWWEYSQLSQILGGITYIPYPDQNVKDILDAIL